MAYGWDEEVRADAPSARFRLGDARGSSTVADAVGGAAGSVRGGVTLAQPSLVESDADGAALFDGSTGFVLIADRAGAKVTNNGAIEFVISATSYRDGGGLAGAIYDGGAREPIIRWAAAFDGRITARINSVGDIVTSLSTIPLNVRTHVRVTFTTSAGTTRAAIYFNGSDVTGTVTAQTITSNALGKCIGAADQGATNFFAGTIDELAIYNAATPTQQRARAHYRAMFGVPATYARSLSWMDQTFASTARTLLRVLRPNGAKVGDVMCVGLRLNSTSVTPGHADWTLPAGGLQTNVTASKNHELAFLWHRIRADDPASWDITWGGSSLTTEGFARVVRGAPASGDPVDVIAGSALSSAGTSVPFAGPTASTRGLTMCVWSRFGSSGFPSQPDHWFYGAGLSGGVASIGTFERQQLGAGKLPYMTNFAGTSDAWTSLQLVIKDGRTAPPAVNIPIGLDGVNSPNDRGIPGWPDGYTPALAIGANYIRMDFGPGTSQADADAEFADAARRGMQVLPLFWSGSGVQISTVNKATFAAALGAFCGRYGPGGTFWASRSDGYLAPVYYEVWNEPYGTWFVGTVEPSQYADLYIQSARAGRAANPRCKFLIAGVDRYFQGTWQDWFAPMFTAQPTLGSYIDGVTVHLYGTRPLDLSYFGNYSEWGGQIDTIGPDLYSRGVDIGGAVKVWPTEFGFNTASNTGASDYGVSEADQASQYLDAQRVLFGRWGDVLGGVFVYRYRDGTRDDKEGKVGIVRNDGSSKPAFLALQATLPAFSGGLLSAPAATSRRPARQPARRPARIPSRR